MKVTHAEMFPIFVSPLKTTFIKKGLRTIEFLCLKIIFYKVELQYESQPFKVSIDTMIFSETFHHYNIDILVTLEITPSYVMISTQLDISMFEI